MGVVGTGQDTDQGRSESIASERLSDATVPGYASAALDRGETPPGGACVCAMLAAFEFSHYTLMAFHTLPRYTGYP